jgi:hypothetical protein
MVERGQDPHAQRVCERTRPAGVMDLLRLALGRAAACGVGRGSSHRGRGWGCAAQARRSDYFERYRAVRAGLRAPAVWLSVVLSLALASCAGDGRGHVDAAAPAAKAPAAWKTSRLGDQLALLRVLRSASRRHDAQVRLTVREWADHGARGRFARLLGKAPSGSAYVLLPVQRYEVLGPGSSGANSDPVVTERRNGLCLIRRGTEGGAGQCTSTLGLLRGELHGALAGFGYGVVPDGVARVRPLPGRPTVAVHHNFYVYPARGSRIANADPEWLDASGRSVPKDGSPFTPPSRAIAPDILAAYAVFRRARGTRDDLPDSAPWPVRGQPRGPSLDVNVDLSRRIGTASGQRAWLVPGETQLCLVTAGPGRGGSLGCGPVAGSGYASGHAPIGSITVGPWAWRPHRRLVATALPDGTTDVRLERDGRRLRALELRDNGVVTRTGGAERLSWTAPDGTRHALGLR